MAMNRQLGGLITGLLTLGALAGCGMTPAAPAPTGAAPAEPAAPVASDAAASEALKRAAITTYADIAYASYADSHALAEALNDKINALVAEPSAQTLEEARAAWLAAQEPYGQTEAYRFYGGPIDDDDGPEGLLNAWPLDEAYVDYVEGQPEAGIINNVAEYPTIDRELLISLNEAGAEENISSGYHAIEFLLWGQDLRADGAGERPFTDYVPGGTAQNQERRSQYLTAASGLLVDNLKSLVDAWDPAQSGNYRGELLALPPDEALQKILTGIGVLAKSELAGERMFTAYDNQDQEDEHSCFSDNTHRDIITNYQGIRNIYFGEYTRLDGSVVAGSGLDDLMAAVNPELNSKMLGLLDKAQSEVNAIYVPFDQAIVLGEERPKVLAAVNTLQDTGDVVAEVATALGLAVNTALPE
jgi:putative iron-regulated protein